MQDFTSCKHGHEEVGADVVALVTSTLIGIVVMVLPFRHFLRKRPTGSALTWGQAMLAATWVFFVMFWFYGVVPHQWLTLADNEWNWRPDREWAGPSFGLAEGIFTKLPFDLNYQHARDFIAVGIYGVGLGLNIAMWMMWQNRGKKKPTGTEIERSGYGRPLVRA